MRTDALAQELAEHLAHALARELAPLLLELASRAAGPAGGEPSRPPRTAYTSREAAEELGLSYKATLRLIKAGQIRARWTGRQYVVPAAAVAEYLAGSR